MMKFTVLTCLYILFFLTNVSSQKLPNTLLWKISGNGLQKPSYLYGTMHLTDERLFSLADSLYSAIENTEGLAIEINPEDITTYMVNEISAEIKNAVLIKEILNKKAFKEYGTALSKKLKKPADKITTRDILLEKNKWVQESFQSGKMSTFLDAYLFDIARRQGKWTGGVEDIDDQKGLFDDLIDESDIRQIATSDKADVRGQADNFIKLYVSGNLNAIDSISHIADSAYRDTLLIKRNYKMSRRIDSMGKIRTMFFAIGAAHLPGKEGLINLLEKKGYTVQPVFSSKKIDPENYKVKEINIPWVTVNDPDSFYRVDMPGKPGDIEMFGVLKMKMNFDIFNSAGYIATATSVPFDKKTIDSIMNSYAVNIFKQKNIQQGKAITINGISGIEMESTDESGYKHGYILNKNNAIYLVVGFLVKKNAKSENDLNKFLLSYKPFERKRNNDAGVYTYIDSAHLFTINIPSKPQPANELAGITKDKSTNTNLMISFDKQSGAVYFFGINEAAPGYFVENDKATLSSIEKNTRSKYTFVKLDTMYTQGKNRILKIEGVIEKTNAFARSYYEITGNRWYALLAMYDSNKSAREAEQFFHSFKILNPRPAEWKLQSSEDKLITTWVPCNIKFYRNDSSELSYSKKYEAYDSILGYSYDIIVSNVGKYYWQNSDTALWNVLRQNNTDYDDTLLFSKPVSNGNIKGIEMQLQHNGSFNIKRKRVLLYGDTLYSLLTVLPQQYINDTNVNKFFDSFRFNQPPGPATIFTSKATKLFNDLSDKDSTVRAEAQQALGSANFSIVDLPLLHQALLKRYTQESNSYRTINEDVARAIINIKDSSSLKMAKEKYFLASDKQIKNLLLEIISEYKTKDNYADLGKLLLQSHPDTALSYSFINNIKDSLALAANLVNSILPLLKDTSTILSVINISSVLIDSNIMSSSVLNPYFEHIASYADYRYKKLKKDNEDYDYQDRYIIALLGRFNTELSNAILKKWLPVSNNYFKLKCIEALLQNGQAVPATALLKLAADKSYRIDLYKSLKKHQKQILFPRQYLTQQYFAESNVYIAASDDDEPSAQTFLTQKIISFKGKKARFFFYKIAYGEEEKSYSLACAGPYDLNTLNMSADDAYGSLYYKENYNQTNLQKQINELIEQQENDN